MLQEICNNKKLSLSEYADGWTLKISKNKKSFFIWGYQFPLDSAPVRNICDDKSSHSEILNKNNVKTFESFWFPSTTTDFSKCEEILNTYKEVVIKPNTGTGGKNVLKASNKKELINAIEKMADVEESFIISPFYKYDYEYRAIVLDSKVKVIYRKDRMFVLGDGESKVAKLIEEKYKKPAAIDPEINIKYKPKKHEKIILNWKHNLAQGATPTVITNGKIFTEIQSLSVKAAKTLGLNFGSVDFAELPNGEIMVVEVNGGVMLEKFSQSSKENYEKSLDIYGEAVSLCLKHN